MSKTISTTQILTCSSCRAVHVSCSHREISFQPNFSLGLPPGPYTQYTHGVLCNNDITAYAESLSNMICRQIQHAKQTHLKHPHNTQCIYNVSAETMRARVCSKRKHWAISARYKCSRTCTNYRHTYEAEKKRELANRPRITFHNHKSCLGCILSQCKIWACVYI